MSGPSFHASILRKHIYTHIKSLFVSIYRGSDKNLFTSDRGVFGRAANTTCIVEVETVMFLIRNAQLLYSSPSGILLSQDSPEEKKYHLISCN